MPPGSTTITSMPKGHTKTNIIERHHSSNSRHPHYIGKCGQFKEYGNKSGISAKR